MSKPAANDLPLVFLPGLNGDARVLAPQQAAFPNLAVATWPPPKKRETLKEYARRLAPAINPGRPCLIGGVSFGGIVALEIAQHVPTLGCVLIATCRDVAGLPNTLRLLRPIGAVAPGNALAQVASWGEHSVIETMPGLLPRFAKLRPEDREFRRWALQALLTWQPPSLGSCPLYQIHGEQDATFPAACSGADTIVANAGHLLTLTHAEIVNDYLRSVIDRCSEK